MEIDWFDSIYRVVARVQNFERWDLRVAQRSLNLPWQSLEGISILLLFPTGNDHPCRHLSFATVQAHCFHSLATTPCTKSFPNRNPRIPYSESFPSILSDHVFSFRYGGLLCATGTHSVVRNASLQSSHHSLQDRNVPTGRNVSIVLQRQEMEKTPGSQHPSIPESRTTKPDPDDQGKKIMAKEKH